MWKGTLLGTAGCSEWNSRGDTHLLFSLDSFSLSLSHSLTLSHSHRTPTHPVGVLCVAWYSKTACATCIDFRSEVARCVDVLGVTDSCVPSRPCRTLRSVPVSPDIVTLGIALGVGLLVGFERERKAESVAGVRTFGLAGLFGGIAALLTPPDGTPWALLLVTAIAAAGGIAGGIVGSARSVLHQANAEEPRASRDIGLTTAFALVATTLLGGYAVLGDRTIAVVAAGVLFLLLYVRDPLHAVIRRLAPGDLRAIAIFVLIALVILPVLPDAEIGPFGAINPRGAWALVVLVVSISLAGYIAQTLLGARAGTLATGLLGGLVSSTAASVGAARRVHETGTVDSSAAIVLLACGVLPLRLIALVGVVSLPALTSLWPWLGVIAAVTIVGGIRVLRSDSSVSTTAVTKPKNPTQLSSALAFAGIFVVVRIATKATVAFAGPGALIAVAAISGVTDMDAIALSTAREVADGALVPELATRATLVALLVNTAFKLGMVRVMGDAKLFRGVLPVLGAAALVAAVGIVFA